MNETEEIKDVAQETPQEPQQTLPEPETPPQGKAELAALENAIYRKHIDAMNAELAELRQKYDIKQDPADTLAEEVRELKGQFAELKAMLQNLPAQMQQQTTPINPSPTPPQQWQTPQAFNLPYISTPSYTPLMPASPLFR